MKKIFSFFALLLFVSFGFASGPSTASEGRADTTVFLQETECMPLPLDDFTFGLVKKSMKEKLAEKSRFRVARQLIRTEYLLTNQILGIMDLFEYENTRLRFAKEAFSSVVDPENYDKVAAAFEMEAHAEGLSDFLERYDSTEKLPRLEAADQETFELLYRKMLSSNSDKNRLHIAKSAVANDYLDCIQVTKMLDAFDGDQARANFACYAYPHVIDPYNYGNMDYLFQDQDLYAGVEDFVRRK